MEKYILIYQIHVVCSNMKEFLISKGSLNGAGASPFGVASDVSGSIRLPALYCGVFGHKPTGGLVPVQGHFPYSHTDAKFAQFLQMGPITRFAQDMPLLVQIMAGKNAHKLKFEEGVKLNELKVNAIII